VIAINIFINWSQSLKQKLISWLNQEFIKKIKEKKW
jgi:hypothetical protein